MSAETERPNIKEPNLDSYTTDELIDMAKKLVAPDLDPNSMTRQELLQVLRVLLEPTATEIEANYQEVFNAVPYGLSVAEQKEALANIEKHKAELWKQAMEEKRDDIKDMYGQNKPKK